jgi:peptidoglycan/xylan/chitin deacetylase (PgdA/CDA1 family)
MSVALAALAIVGVGFGAYFVVPWLIKPLLTRRLVSRVRRSESVCLTFDDGPDPSSTPRILDALEAAGAKATFFMLGRNALRHPSLVQKIAESGHEIGEHGFGHCHAWKTGPLRYIADLVQGRRALAEVGGPPAVSLYRPAFGELNLLTLLYLLVGRRRLVMWNVNPRDFEARSGPDVARQVARDVGAGSVILMHDGREDATTDAEVTVEAVKLILRDLKESGLRLTTVSAASTEHAA